MLWKIHKRFYLKTLKFTSEWRAPPLIQGFLDSCQVLRVCFEASDKNIQNHKSDNLKTRNMQRQEKKKVIENIIFQKLVMFGHITRLDFMMIKFDFSLKLKDIVHNTIVSFIPQFWHIDKDYAKLMENWKIIFYFCRKLNVMSQNRNMNMQFHSR